MRPCSNGNLRQTCDEHLYDIGLTFFRPECLQGAELYVVLKVPLAPCWECTILSKKKCPPKLGWGGAVQLEDI